MKESKPGISMELLTKNIVGDEAAIAPERARAKRSATGSILATMGLPGVQGIRDYLFIDTNHSPHAPSSRNSLAPAALRLQQQAQASSITSRGCAATGALFTYRPENLFLGVKGCGGPAKGSIFQFPYLVACRTPTIIYCHYLSL
jgi:hypothetical protein